MRELLVGETAKDTLIQCMIVFSIIGLALSSIGMFLWDVLDVPERVWQVRVLVARRGCTKPGCVMCQLRADEKRATAGSVL